MIKIKHRMKSIDKGDKLQLTCILWYYLEDACKLFWHISQCHVKEVRKWRSCMNEWRCYESEYLIQFEFNRDGWWSCYSRNILSYFAISSSDCQFRDLSDYKFSGKEKTWLCEQVLLEHSSLKLFLPPKFKFNAHSVSKLYNIAQRSLANWLQRYQYGQKLYNSTDKRPKQLDISAVMTAYEEAAVTKQPLSKHALSDLITHEKIETATNVCRISYIE